MVCNQVSNQLSFIAKLVLVMVLVLVLGLVLVLVLVLSHLLPIAIQHLVAIFSVEYKRPFRSLVCIVPSVG